MSCTSWRKVEDRINWFLNNNPSSTGMCAQHTWHALGGNKSPACPPAWSCSNANQVYDKVKASGKYKTSTPIPRGAAIYWKYGSNGHAALSLGDGNIATTDPSNGKMVGIEPLSYPSKWGATSSARIWTDTYNGVTFDIGGNIDDGYVYVSKLVYGQEDSDSVRRLQVVLNDTPLQGGANITVTGNYGDATKAETKKWQEQKSFDKSVVDGSMLTPAQADQLFTGSGNTVIDDTVSIPPQPPTEPEVPDVPEAGWTDHTFGLWKWYSGKETATFSLDNDGDWHKILKAQPASGISEESSEHHFLYLRIEMPGNRTADRTVESKFVRSDGDATAYHSPAWTADAKDSVAEFNAHFEDGSGLGGQWWVKVSGGNIDITTRYAKTHLYYQDVVETASATLMGIGSRLGTFWGWPLLKFARWLKDPATMPRLKELEWRDDA